MSYGYKTGKRVLAGILSFMLLFSSSFNSLAVPIEETEIPVETEETEEKESRSEQEEETKAVTESSQETESQSEIETEAETVEEEPTVLDLLLDNVEDIIEISDEEELLSALGSMRNGDSKTLKLKKPISLTKSMHLTSSGTYSVTIIGEGEDTVVSSNDSIRLFTLKSGTINLTLDNVILDGKNKAGGVVVSDSANLTLNGSGNSIVRNMTDTHGGALRASEATVELENLTLQNNKAGKNGGAVYAYSSRINAGNVIFHKNEAGTDGGALYQYDTSGTIQIKSSVFTNNTAGNYGGAIAGSSTGLTLQQTTVSGNKAKNGGGVFLRTGTMSAQLNITSNSRVVNNTAEYNGGGVYVESARAGVSLTTSSVVEKNKAEKGNGGGMYLHESSNVHVNNAEVSANTAKNGGGLFVYNSNTLTCVNSTIKGNEATENGGGAYCSVTSSISSTTFSGNKAKNGGGLYNSNSTKIILNSSIMDGNTATQNGGAIGLDENSWNISAGMNTFKNNKAAYSVETLNAADQAIHDTIMMVNTSYGTFNYTYPFKHALNNYDVWNTGESADLVFKDESGDPTVTGLPSKLSYAVGASILLPIETPVRANHTFLGWAKKANAVEPDYVTDPTAASKEDQDLWYTMESNENILYAVWARNTVTVSFDPNGGSFTDTGDDIVTKQVEYDNLIEDPPELNRRFGYEFVGWYYEKYDEVLEGVSDPAGIWDNSISITTNIELYACWKQVPFPIGNGEFGGANKYEQLLSEALNSARVTINIHLYDNIKLTDAMRVSNMAETGLVVNFVSKKQTENSTTPVNLIQTKNERHFYIRNAETEVTIGLDNVNVDSESGYGGIEVNKGTLRLKGITGGDTYITGSKEHFAGGAVLAKDGAEVHIESIVLRNNMADYGGAISASGGAQVILSDVTIEGNSAKYGGGIELSDTAGLTMRGTVCFRGNDAEWSGGGLYVADETVGVAGARTEFISNKAKTHGGAIGLGILGREGETLLENIELTNVSWNANSAGEEYVVDVVKASDKSLYDHLAGTEQKVWDGNHISYLFNIYTVAYHMGNAPAKTPEDSLCYGEGYKLELPGADEVALEQVDAPWKYRSLVGWSQNLYETNQGNARKNLTFEGDITDIILYPVWKHETAVITFDPGEGTFGAESPEQMKELIGKLEKLYPDYGFAYESKCIKVTVEKGTVLSPPDSGYLSHDDKYFQYWYREGESEENHYTFADAITEDIKVIAWWGTIPNEKALLTFHTDGGTYIDPILVESNETKLTGDDLVNVKNVKKTGHTLLKWFTEETEGERTEWNPENFAVTGGRNYDIYAEWEADTYDLTIKIDPKSGGKVNIKNGGVISDEDKRNFSFGTPVNLKAVANEGYYFAGWIIDNDLNDGYNLSDELDITITNNMTVTANFEKQTHVVTFYEGRRLLQTLLVKHGDSFTEDEVPAAPEGYIQTWYTGTDSNRTEATFSEPTIITENVNFERELTAEKYKVTLHGNGGTIGEEGRDKICKTVSYDDVVGNLDEEKEFVTRPYYEFAGWSTSEEINLPWNLNADAVHHNLDLYAVWDTVDAPAPKLNSVKVAQDEVIEVNPANPDPLEIVTGLTSFLALAEVSYKDPFDENRDVLTYRWILTDENETTRTVMSDSELIQYVASFSTSGVYYCYLEVTNTNDYYSGKTSATTRSETIRIEITRAVPQASHPLIEEHPGDQCVKVGKAAKFKVNATSPDNDVYGKDANDKDYAELSYQWYELTPEGPKEIEGATNENYSFNTKTVGESLYYVVVTNTLNYPEGNITSQSVVSNTAKLTVWTKYTVTYYTGEVDRGNPPQGIKKYKAGEVVTVLGNDGDLEKEGYTFIGWSREENSSDVEYEPDSVFVMPEEDIKLYPVWKAEPSTYTVTYHDTGAERGEAPEDTNKYKAGDTVTVLDNTDGLGKKGYSFEGWSQEENSTDVEYAGGSTFEMPEGDVSLHPVWKAEGVVYPQNYTVKYHKNGADRGEAPEDTNRYKAGDTVTVLGNIRGLKKEGYIFAGWSEEENTSDIEKVLGKSFLMPEKNVDLYPVWKQDMITLYSVIYNAGGADSGYPPVDPNRYKPGDTVTVLENSGELARTGYIFKGWLVDLGDGEIMLKAGKTFTMPEGDVSLTAVWDEETVSPAYSVIYHVGYADSGMPPIDSNRYKTGDAVTILDNTGKLKKAGYTFAGWSLNLEGTGDIYKAGMKITMGGSDLILYAVWQEEEPEPADPDPIVKPDNNKKKNTGTNSSTGKKSGISTSAKKAVKSPKTGDLTTERYPILLLLTSAAVLILLKKKRFISK